MSRHWFFIAAAIIIASCSSLNPASNFSQTTFSGASFERQRAQDGLVAQDEEARFQEPVSETDRIILKDASLTITVEDAAAKVSAIATLAESLGGWVVSSSTFTRTDSAGNPATYGSITVRVPADRLAATMEQIKSGTVSVDLERVNGQDVTADYVDLSGQLRNLEATEKQLQAIMEQANTVEDVLAVQRELTTVQGQIESIQGRLKYYREAAAFSSINIEVQPVLPGPIQSQSAGWSPQRTAESAFGFLLAALHFLVDAAVAIIIVGLPLGLLVGTPVWLLWRALRRRRTQRPQSLASR